MSQSSAFFVTYNCHVQDLQNIIKSRSSGSSVSLFESFKQRAEEAAKIPAEILKAPTEAFQPAPEAPAIPLPITKALPQPTSKAAAGSAPVHVAHLVFVICTSVRFMLYLQFQMCYQWHGSAQRTSSLSLFFGTCSRLWNISMALLATSSC